MRRSAVGSLRAVAVFALVAAGGMATGCHSPYTTIAPEVPVGAERLGTAHGKSTAAIAGPGHWVDVQFIPVYWSGRNQEAYDRAVASVPGATALGKVTIREDYFFWIFCWTRTLHIEGEGVR